MPVFILWFLVIGALVLVAIVLDQLFGEDETHMLVVAIHLTQCEEVSRKTLAHDDRVEPSLLYTTLRRLQSTGRVNRRVVPGDASTQRTMVLYSLTADGKKWAAGFLSEYAVKEMASRAKESE
ncbi:hypothetical protein HQ524_04330 [Candidatus Uhrbacteria bacterium]|nr:hypothetical protein [Candidatus Uhrbacteria bacterium]